MNTKEHVAPQPEVQSVFYSNGQERRRNIAANAYTSISV